MSAAFARCMLLPLRPARCSLETACVCFFCLCMSVHVCDCLSGSDTFDQLVCGGDSVLEVTTGAVIEADLPFYR